VLEFYDKICRRTISNTKEFIFHPLSLMIVVSPTLQASLFNRAQKSAWVHPR
jgi:hypothetical protein